MLTIVTLLLLSAVLCMSIFRVFQLPQSFLSGGSRLNRRRRRTAAEVLAVTYCALTANTVLVLYTAGRIIWYQPKTLQALIPAAAVGVAYPFVWLVSEWVLFHSIERVGRNGP